MTATRRRLHLDEDGASAVEFGLLLPILVLVLFGIVEFSRAYNAKISLSAAAREGARVMAVENDEGRAKTAVINAAPSLNPPISDIVILPSPCSAGSDVTVTVKYKLPYDIPLWREGDFTLTGIGVMRCGG